MTFNRLKYKRTADVDTLIYHGVSASILPSTDITRTSRDSVSETTDRNWTYIELVDYSGDSQTMRTGDKFNVFQLFSLVYHHNAYINKEMWEFKRDRPVVYLNISNFVINPVFVTFTLAITSSLTSTTIHKLASTTTTLWTMCLYR